MPRITIDGLSLEVPEGTTVFAAAQKIGIDIPHLCQDDRLKPFGGCRMCLVSVAGAPHLVSSCNTPVHDGMSVATRSSEAESSRRETLIELARHSPEAPVRSAPELPLHRYFEEYGIVPAGETPEFDVLKDDSHPYIAIDMTRCIDCMRCVRICGEVAGRFVWQAAGRGERMRIVPDSLTTLAASSCVSCGACADTCPTGAIIDKAVIRDGVPTRWTRTVCPYCGTGCELEAGTKDGKLIACRPAPDAAVNRGHLCVKGRYAFDYVHAGDRVTDPMIREHGVWRKTTWDEALGFTAALIQRAIGTHGPDSLGFLGSARATNEENYLLQKLARVAVGTNNVDCCARVCHTPSAAALKAMLGTGAATNSFDDIEAASLIFVAGANPTECHPIVGDRIRQAKLNGAKLIVADPRLTDLARVADIHLPVTPGGNVPLFNAMACVLIEEGLVDADFISRRVAEWDEFRDFIRTQTPETAAPLCGVDAPLIRKAARLYATCKPAFSCHGLGLTEHVQGTEGVMCLINLALLTGNLGKPGTGVNPLRGQNNVQGAAHMGCDPSQLTGLVPIKDASHRARFAAAWGRDLPESKGLNLLQMVDAAGSGKLKGLWAFGFDLYLTLANMNATEKALSKLDFVIVQDLFLNETADAFGTVFFPASSSFEKDGTFMNSDRRVQRVRAALPPLGNSRPDWEILKDVASRLGFEKEFSHPSPEDIWNEIRAVWPGGRGLSYDRIARESLHWPCPDATHPGTPVLYEDRFAVGDRASLKRIAYAPTPESVDAAFPFLLTTGRTLFHFNAGTMTRRTPNLEIHCGDFLDMSPADAARLGVKDGERVRILSRHGKITLPLRIRNGIEPGQLFATFHEPAARVNRITSPFRDGITLAPEYKVTAVNVRKIGMTDSPPPQDPRKSA